VERRLRSLRAPLAPEGVDELVAADDLAGVQQQQPEHRQLLRPNRREIDPGRYDLEFAQHPELHDPPILAAIPR